MTPTSYNEAKITDWIDLLQKGVTAVATAGDNKYVGRNYSYSSAAKAASNLIAVFPTICSSSISSDTAYIISKAVERKAFVILQLALTAANITNMRDGIEYLRQFHQNLKTNSSMADYMMAIDKFADANGGVYADDRAEARRALNMNYRNESGTIPLDNIKETSINDFMIREMGFGALEITGRVISEAHGKWDYDNDDYKAMMAYERDNARYRSEREKDSRESNREYNNQRISAQRIARQREEGRNKWEKAHADSQARSDKSYEAKARYDTKRAEYDAARVKAEKERAESRKEYDTERYGYERDQAKAEKERSETKRDYERREYERREAERQQEELRRSKVVNYIKPPMALRDQDVKKMNELVPMIMNISFKNAETGADVNFIVGIKSKCIKAHSDEIIKKIYNNNQDGKGLVNFIRATTGEIKFVRDLLLGLDQNKQDVIAASKRGSNEEIWNTLKIRAQNAKMYLRQGAVNYASAITTVVISQEDADYMYKTMNIDINNPHTALQFMKAYNLLGFCIVDDTVEEAKFLWDDGDPKFESVSYTMLEREEKDQSYKKVVNLLAKMR